MMFFAAVLALWAADAFLGRAGGIDLPPLFVYGIWTIAMYLPGVAAVEESWEAFHSRLGGIFGYTLFALYYIREFEGFAGFLPYGEDPTWRVIFLMVNVLAPLAVVTTGCLSPAVQRR